jgi:hypothetical protein
LDGRALQEAIIASQPQCDVLPSTRTSTAFIGWPSRARDLLHSTRRKAYHSTMTAMALISMR